MQDKLLKVIVFDTFDHFMMSSITTLRDFLPHEDIRLRLFHEADISPLPMTSLTLKKDDEEIEGSITPSIKRSFSSLRPDEDSGLGWDRNKLPMTSLMLKKDVEEIEGSITPSIKRSFSGFSPDEDSGLGWDRNKNSPFMLSCSRLAALKMDDVTKPQSSMWSPHEIKGQERNIVQKRLFINQESMSGTKRPLKDACTPVFKKTRSSNITSGENIADAKVSVIDAVDRLSGEPGLIANGTRSYCLPTVPGKHRDLTSISYHTMAALVRGNYSDDIGKVTIIDCRYPYEYNGGHIKGAVNIYLREGIRKLLSLPRDQSAHKNHIIVFHCEFSSERGPKMYRFLRSEDRELHKENYPQLSYPEVYLLDGGYKAFFESYKELCEPDKYTPMLNNDNAEDLRHFRAASKSSATKMKRHQSRQALRF